MTASVLEITDQNLRLTHAGKTICSPGYALLRRGQPVVVGAKAKDQARIFPGDIQNSYWQSPTTHPLAKPHAHARTHADLIWHHLKFLSTEVNLENLIFLVPAHYSAEQHALLLGIAQSLGIQVQALINRSVLMASRHIQETSLEQLDVQLHQTLMHSLVQQNGLWSMQRTTVLPGKGFNGLWDRMAHHVQRVFIENTRFDPFHEARTEQSLYDALPDWLHQLSHEFKMTVSLQPGDRIHSVTLHRDTVQQATREILQIWQVALQASAGKVIVDETVGDFFRLHGVYSEAMQGWNTPLQELCAAHAGWLTPSSATGYICRLPAVDISTPAEELSADNSLATPRIERDSIPATHILCNGYASSAPCYLGLNGDTVMLYPDPCEPCLAHFERNAQGQLICVAASVDLRMKDQPMKLNQALNLGDELLYCAANSTETSHLLAICIMNHARQTS